MRYDTEENSTTYRKPSRKLSVVNYSPALK